ncbi:MAG: hypothetical protein B7X06_03100 [Verrucomicrobia bacterium 21-51-4]|nr:MAG: hypothetical protein B7X06_03100 [Verrucomicrobia bacterium 21-51-4]
MWIRRAAPDLVFIEKPAGIWIEGIQGDQASPELTRALLHEIKRAKPEWLRLGLEYARPIYPLDLEISGGAAFATQPEGLAKYRNAFGSEQWLFSFVGIAHGAPAELQWESALPMLQEYGQPRMRVSHRFGKKAATAFIQLEQVGPYTLWQMKTSYPRPHQLRLHAAEGGIRLLGEELYLEEPMPIGADFKKPGRWKGATPTQEYTGIALHLQRVDVPEIGAVDFPWPKRLEGLWTKIKKKYKAQ